MVHQVTPLAGAEERPSVLASSTVKLPVLSPSPRQQEVEKEMVEVVKAYDALVKKVLERCEVRFCHDEYARLMVLDGMVLIACPTLEYGYYDDASLEPDKGSVPVKDLL